MILHIVLRLFLLKILTVRLFASLYDPHVFPEDGPFFEGWYMRATDFDTHDSFGLLFGSVLPTKDINVTDPLVVASFLQRRCNIVSGTCTLSSEDGRFSLDNLNITARGKAVTEDPDKVSPPNFKWQVSNGKQGGVFFQTGEKTEFNFKLGNMTVRGEASNPFYWNQAGTGPEGWLINLPLPLHWFVYSLRSEVIFYEIQNLTSGAVVRGSHGTVHLEKNWGKSFPEKWIWSQGVSFDDSNASFALSGGQVDFSLIKVDAYLIGYRKPTMDLSVDFRPDSSTVNIDVNGCKGYVNLTASSALYSIDIFVSADEKTYGSCLLGPKAEGFRPVCVESFDATATVKVYRRSMIPFQYKLIDKETFSMSALEYGGKNVCNDHCMKDTQK